MIIIVKYQTNATTNIYSKMLVKIMLIYHMLTLIYWENNKEYIPFLIWCYLIYKVTWKMYLIWWNIFQLEAIETHIAISIIYYIPSLEINKYIAINIVNSLIHSDNMYI